MTTEQATPWKFNRNYDDYTQVEPLMQAFRKRLAELEATGQYRYNASFKGELGVEFDTDRDEDSAIFMCQRLDYRLAHEAAVAALIADGWTRTTTPGKYAEVKLVNDYEERISTYTNVRVVEHPHGYLMILPARARTRGYSAFGRRVFVKGDPA